MYYNILLLWIFPFTFADICLNNSPIIINFNIAKTLYNNNEIYLNHSLLPYTLTRYDLIEIQNQINIDEKVTIITTYNKQLNTESNYEFIFPIKNSDLCIKQQQLFDLDLLKFGTYDSNIYAVCGNSSVDYELFFVYCMNNEIWNQTSQQCNLGEKINIPIPIYTTFNIYNYTIPYIENSAWIKRYNIFYTIESLTYINDNDTVLVLLNDKNLIDQIIEANNN
ncbi:hypothetical protein [Alphaentomopoxvirus acuprea]|uniref:Uncharacterized protein n=1 Tax=Alphaentomopoxvirus acuprea TaxID=62099 RepID=W6JIL9_9POXV|nr:hypothetical protein BA82_gp027 [Anomala cuprea entomopoxvirus]BAO49387.1 hypothetical protein [Anomala cuprea entomopoxvirus]